MKKIAVLLTVFNRRDVTIKGLASLYKSIDAIGSDYSFDIYMTNDGCTDGTAEVVIKYFPLINIIQGDGSLYWGGGMLKAWNAALQSKSQYDFFYGLTMMLFFMRML